MFIRKSAGRASQRRCGKKCKSPSRKPWRGVFELLEARQLLSGNPTVLSLDPSGTVQTPVTKILLDFSEPLLPQAACLADNYALTHLGVDRLPGGGDDQAVPIVPRYTAGSTRVELAPIANLASWSEIDYGFPSGLLGDWQFQDGGRSVVQTANGGASFFVSDTTMIDGQFAGRMKVKESGGDDDFIGVVFGFQADTATAVPEHFYLLSWKQLGQGAAETGLKLAKITGTGSSATQPDLWDLESSNAHVQVLAVGPAVGWEDQREYDFQVDYQSSGEITVLLRDAADGDVVWSTQVVDTAPLGAGKVGFYNLSQPQVRYTNLNTSVPLADGHYQVVARSGPSGLGDLDGNELDGNADGTGGDDFSAVFQIDTGAASVALDMQSGSDTGMSSEDNITKTRQPKFDVAVSEPGRIDMDFDGNGTTDATQVVNGAGVYTFTANYTADNAYTVKAAFLPASGDPEPVLATLPVKIDTTRPQLLGGANHAAPDWSQYALQFNEDIDPGTFMAADVVLKDPAAAAVAVDSVAGAQRDYLLSFPAQSALGKYVLTVGPNIADVAGNTMSGAATWNVYLVSPDEQRVLFVNVNGGYNGDAWNCYQTVLAAGSRADWVNLDSVGDVVTALQAAAYDQVWVFDLSGAADNYAADWQAIGDWYNAGPARPLVCDARIISSYWNGRWQNEGLRLSENYYENLKAGGGGLALGTDHNAYHAGINSINPHIGIGPFTGNFNLAYIPVDTANPLMTTPNDMGTQLYDDSTPGQAPYGIQANGRILYTVAWHGANANTPGISSTIPGVVGFHVEIASPADNATVAEGATVRFIATPSEGTEPITYSWFSDLEGSLGSGDVLDATGLRPGRHKITVVSTESGGGADEDVIYLNVSLIAPTVALDLQAGSDSGASYTDNLTNDTTPTFDVTVNKAGRIDLDYDGDGTWDAGADVPAAGTYAFTPDAAMVHGARQVMARFSPIWGSPVPAGLNVDIDTLGPTLLPGAASEQAPLYSRQITFSEAIADPAPFLSGATLIGPGGASSAIRTISGGGPGYMVTFDAAVAPGEWTLSGGAGIVDRAGNLFDQDQDGTPDAPIDAFTMLPDVTRPAVMSVSPAGPVNQDWDRLTATFTEAMQAEGLAQGLVISGPSGIVDSGLFQATPLDSTGRRFQIDLSLAQTAEGTYTITFGAGARDLAGNPVLPFSAVITLDKTPPAVTSLSSSLMLGGMVGHVDVTFSEPIDRQTWAAADITLNAPGGAAVPVNEPVSLGGNTYRVSFTPQRTNGAYALTIGPVINDLAGNPMTAAYSGGFAVSLPDLEVTSVTPAASAAEFGGTLDLAWQVTNSGTAAPASGWSERIWLSANAVLDVGDIALATVAAPGPLPYTGSATVTLPLDHALTEGTYYLIVETDAGHAVVEANEGNNAEIKAPITLAYPPLPDLSVSEVSAPAAAAPGTSVPISWKVTNLGTAAAAGPWSETVYLSLDGGLENLVALKTFTYEQTLAPEGSAVRSASVMVPVSGPSGHLRFVVRVDSGNRVFESNEDNNAERAPDPTNIAAVLTISLPAAQVLEDAVNPAMRGVVTRNGDLSQPLLVALASGDATEAIVPTTVTIYPGQPSAAFPISVVADHGPDGTQTVALTASAVGYTDGTASFQVLDVDKPSLAITLSAGELQEGATATATVTRDWVTAEAVTVSLSASRTGQVTLPQSVTIPANQAAVTFVLGCIDDEVPEQDEVLTLRATAQGFNPGTTSVSVLDEDLPTISLELAGDSISEGAGPTAMLVRLRRASATNVDQVVRLTSSDTTEAAVPAEVIIPAGAASVEFYLAAIDDQDVDGTHTVTLSAVGVIPSCGCGMDPSSTGVATAQVQVTDDDGPTLRVVIEKSLLAEGQPAAAKGRVYRNTGTTGRLWVSLASSDVTEALVPTQVLIEDGFDRSEEFTITTPADELSDGPQEVRITAAADGYAPGEQTLVVTDRDVPDLVVSTAAGPGTVYTQRYDSISYTVKNAGLVPAVAANATETLPGSWQDRVFLSDDPIVGNDILVGTYTFTGTLSHNPDANWYTRSVPFRAPLKPGTYWVVVSTDLGNTVAEGIDGNNTMIGSQPIQVEAAYHATVQADVTVALAGTPVLLTGQATRNDNGLPAAFEMVNIHIEVRGTKRVIAALADEVGHFTATFKPLPGEGGYYSVGAAHPGELAAEAQDHFTLVGMRAEPPAATVTVTEGQTATARFTLRNLSEVALTGMAIEVLSKPENLHVALPASLPTVLPGLATHEVQIQVTAENASVVHGTVQLRLTTAEGAMLDVPIEVSVQQLRSRLVASASPLTVAVLRGQQRIVEFQVMNQGSAPTGPIEVRLPDLAWLALATSQTVPSLAPGESATVALVLTPPADAQLTAYEGDFVLAASDSHLSVPFTFRVVSEARGDLSVTAVDEFFFFTEEAPKLSGATVTVRDAVTRTVVASAVTDTSGTIMVRNLREGYYTIEVEAADHDKYSSTAFLHSGTMNAVRAYLPRQTVKHVWNVEPTEIEDRYKITVDTTFETNVPAPVVTVEPALIDMSDLLQVGQKMQVELTLTNHGWISAYDTELFFGDHPEIKITPLVQYIGELPAKGSLTVPVLIERVAPLVQAAAAGAPGASGAGGSGICQIPARTVYRWVCIDDQWVAVPIYTIPPRDFACPNRPAPGGGGGGGSGGGVGGGGGGHVRSVPVQVVPQTCSECEETEYSFSACFGGGFLGRLASKAAEKIVSLVPFLDSDDISLELCFEFTTQRCCENGRATGEWSKEITVSGTFSVEAFLGPEGEVEFPGVYVPAIGQTVGIELEAGIGANVTLAGSVSGTAKKDCGKDWEWCVEAALSAELFVGVMAEAEVNVAGQKVEGRAQVGLKTGAQFGLEWCKGGQPQLSGCYDDLVLTAGVEFEWNDTTVSADVSRELLDGTCDDANAVATSGDARGAGDPAEDPGDPAAEVMPTDVLAAALGFASTAALEQAYGVALGPELSDSELNQILTLHVTREDQSGGACARVKLRIEQQAVLTRDAFDATLELINETDQALTGVSVELVISDSSQQAVTEWFGVYPPAKRGFSPGSGSLGDLQSRTTGTAHWLIVPTPEAAMAGPTEYYVSGVLKYTENGLELTIPLAPLRITVLPQPELDLKYFHQRDVFSDDPWTDEIEPSQPFELAVMVHNRGYGEARDLRIESAQPKIVENEKGLLIDFQIIATQVAGENLTPSLTARFGDLAPDEIKVARWYLTSTMQGQFIDYAARFEHLSELDDPRLSLVKNVEIHELIHAVTAYGVMADGKPDFLTNDLPDPNDMADSLHLSDGTVESVGLASDASVAGTVGPANRQVQVSATMSEGWCYLRLQGNDPGGEDYRLVRVVRSDGVELPAENFWQTDRTFIELGRRPRYENNLHLLDYNAAAGQYTYTLTYEPRDQVGPVVTQLELQPPASEPRQQPVEGVKVTFSEPIQPGTFGRDALSLTRNGSAVAIGPGVTVQQLTDTEYQMLGLTDLNPSDGQYVLTVNATGVQDSAGNSGSGSKSLTWTRALAGPAIALLDGVPPAFVRFAPDHIDVTFTRPVNMATLTAEDIVLARNAGPDLLVDSLDLLQTGPQTYRIGSLAGLTSTEGHYELTVSAAGVEDLEGHAGIGQQSASWTLDTVGPTAAFPVRIALFTNSRMESNTVTFSEPIDSSSFDYRDLTLTRDGGVNLMTSAVGVRHLGNNVWQITGVGPLNLVGGQYTLSLDVAGVRDLAGNPGSGVALDSWYFDNIPPAPPTHLAISPDTGISDSDRLTNTLALTVNGTLAEDGLSVSFFDTTTGTNLGSAVVTGTDFSREVTLASSGTHVLRVTVTDPAGNQSQMLLSVFVDQIYPMVSDVDMPERLTGTAADKVLVEFSERMDLQALIADGSIVQAVTLSGQRSGAIPLAASQFTYDDASQTLTISLAALEGALPEGDYELRLDGSRLRDRAGNALRGGSGGWEVLNLTAFAVPTLVQANGVNLRAAGYSVPTVADWNADGLQDLLVGEKLTTGLGKVRVYLNTGTVGEPVFETFSYVQATGADLGVPGSGCQGAFPRVFDWNGDGQQDLLVGQADGRVALFLNTSADADPQFGSPIYLQVGLPGAKADLDVGERATLEIVDYNSDGRYDLVMGAYDGKVRLYLNQATSGPADFRGELLLQDDSGDLVVPTGRSSPSVTDLDGDGRKDLLVGNTEGQLLFYANTGTDAAPAFNGYQLLQTGGAAFNLPGEARARPFLADFNQDGILDLLVGAADGYVRLLAGRSETARGQEFNRNDGAAGASYAYTSYVVPLPQITVTPISGLVTTEAGGTATFSIVLDRHPEANVTIALSTSDAGEGVLSTTSLTFTPANWNVPQVVTVRGVDDLLADGPVAYAILTAPAASDDPLYSGMAVPDIAVTNQDITRIWTGAGADHHWSTAANWSGNQAPQAGEHLVFSGTARQDSVNDLAARIRFHALTFTTSGFSLSGSAIELDAQGGEAVRNEFAEYGVNTLGLPIALASGAVISTAPGSSRLVFTSTASIDLGDHSLAFDSSSPFNTQFAGVIAGSGGFTKTGTAQVDFTAAHTYSGLTTIVAGSISVSGAGTLGSAAGRTIVADGASLAVVGPLVVSEPITVSGSGAGSGALLGLGYADLSGPITLAGDARIGVLGPSPTFEISGAISDGGLNYGITIDGANSPGRTLVLSGANSYGGATSVVNAATLRLGAANAVPAGSTLTVAPGAMLDENGFGSPSGTDVPVTDSVPVHTWTGGGASNLWSDPANWTGGTPQAGSHLVFSGTQRQAAVNDLPAGMSFHAVTFTRAGFTLSGNRIVLDPQGGMAVRNEYAAIGTSRIELPITLASGGTIATAEGLSRFEFAPSATLDTAGQVLVFDSDSIHNSCFAGAITGTGSFVKTGTSQVDFTAANPYAGLTTVVAGSISLSGNATLGSTAGGTLVADGASLALVGPVVVPEAITVTGDGNGGGGALTGLGRAVLSGSITLAGNAHIVVLGPSPSLELSGPLSDGGQGYALTFLGTGSLGGVVLLSAASTYGGPTTVAGGATLSSHTANALASGNAVQVSAESILDLGGFDLAVGPLTGSGTVNLGSATLTVGAGQASSEFSGALLGRGALVKDAPGTTVFSGCNTYRGGTTVLAGTLRVNNAAALPAGGALTIGAGGTVVLGSGLGAMIAAPLQPLPTNAPAALAAEENAVPCSSPTSSLAAFPALRRTPPQPGAHSQRVAPPVGTAQAGRAESARMRALRARAHDRVFQAEAAKRVADELNWLEAERPWTQPPSARKGPAFVPAVDAALASLRQRK